MPRIVLVPAVLAACFIACSGDDPVLPDDVGSPPPALDCVDYTRYAHWITRSNPLCLVRDLAGVDDEWLYVLREDLSGSYVQVVRFVDGRFMEQAYLVDTPGTPADLDVRGAFLFVADGPSGIQVFDAANHTTPSLRSTLAEGIDCREVLVRGFHLYALAGTQLLIYDITDPSSPVERGAATVPSTSLELEVSGRRAYFLSDVGLGVVDVANAAFPTVIGTVASSDFEWPPQDIAAHGDVVYAAESFLQLTKLEAIDVTDPLAPISLGSVFGGSISQLCCERYMDVIVHNARVYWGTAELAVLDVTTNSGLDVLDWTNITGDVGGLWTANNRLYVYDSECLLHAIQLGDPLTPAIRRGFLSGGYRDLAVRGRYAYAATVDGLDIIDVGGTDLRTVGHVSDNRNGLNVAVVDDLAFVAFDYQESFPLHEPEIRLVDVSVPSDPRYLAWSHKLSGYFEVGELAIHDGFLYHAFGQLLRMWDLSTPRLPQEISVPVPGTAYDVAFQDELAFVATGFTALTVVDVSNPGSPRVIGASNGPLGVHGTGVAVRESFAYVLSSAAGGSIEVFDVSVPGNPEPVGSVRLYDGADLRDAAVAGGVLYVTDGEPRRGGTPGLYVLDVGGQPTGPTFVAAWRHSGLAKLVVDGDRLFALGSERSDGLHALKAHCAR